MNDKDLEILEAEMTQHFKMDKGFGTGFYKTPQYGQIYITLSMIFRIRYSSRKTISIGCIKSEETQYGLVMFESPELEDKQITDSVEIEYDDIAEIIEELKRFDLVHEDASISTSPNHYHIDVIIYSGRAVTQITYRGEYKNLSAESHINLYEALLQASREIIQKSDHYWLNYLLTHKPWGLL